jgi:type I restriction enzyme, S subunit
MKRDQNGPFPRRRLADVVKLNPRQFDAVPAADELVSFVPMAAVEEGTGRLDATETRAWQQVSKGYTRFQEGDVLFAKITPCMENGKLALATKLRGGRGAGSTEFHVLRCSGSIVPEYLLHYLLQQTVRADAQRLMQGAAGQLRVPESFLADLEVPLPDVRAQREVVSALDALLTRLDRAVAALKRVQANLKRYRASVLKAACEGRLVPTESELARREGREYEPATVLLERNLRERRRKWEETELSKMRAKGKEPTDDRWKGKYVEPKALDSEALPQLPRGWSWATWAQLSTRVTVGHVGPMRREYQPSGIPFLRSQNVRENRFDPEGLLFISEKFHKKLAKSALRAGDLVVVRSGGVGITCVIPDHLGEANCADLVVVQQPLGVLPTFGAFYMNSVAKSLVRTGQVGIALTHFNTRSVAALPVAVPPISEQRRLVDEAGRRLSLCSAMEEQCSNALRRASALRQAIVRSAFEGRLTSASEKVLAGV